MRLQPIIGKKLWFGPRRWGGWGWTPVSWEGWVVTAVFVGATVVMSAVLRPKEPFTPTVLLVGALLLVCWLKGTSPGGPTASRMLKIQEEREEDERR